MSTPTQRVITLHDQETAQRLLNLWSHKKSELFLTQAKIAKKLGISQPCFNQYLHCKVPLNTDIIFKIAEILRVSPSDIDPKLGNVRTLFSLDKMKPTIITIPIIGSTSGRIPMRHIAVEVPAGQLHQEEQYAGIMLETGEYVEHFGCKAGTVICLATTQDPFNKDEMVVYKQLGYEIFVVGQIANVGERKLTIKDFRTGKPIKIARSEINQIYKVHSIHRA
jgi:transcriptional regulator with XRE-family HTH domain